VEIKAISVNPVDYKVRATVPADDDAWSNWMGCKWDCKEVGADVTLKVGDEVWYAGDITRQGACTIQIVDERMWGQNRPVYPMLKLLLYH
jgi:NADPH:quinone reductase-like Zn-dependent oxidoreductase